MNFIQSAGPGLLAAALALCGGAMAQGTADKAPGSGAATSSGKSGKGRSSKK